MKRYTIAALAIITILFTASAALAAGTPASTAISNQASVAWQVGTATFSGNSNTDTIYVDELIDFTLTWQDTPNVGVEPAQLGARTVYRLTNTGNGPENFTLATLTALTPGGDEHFDPAVNAIWLDTNLDGTADVQYLGAAFTVDGRAAIPSVDIFVLCDIPTKRHDGSTDVASGDEGNVRVTATSATTAGAGGLVAAGTVYTNAGPAGAGGPVDSVVADSTGGGFGGQLNVTGTYEISTAQVTVVKTSTISDPFLGNSPVPGATITYQLAVTHTGSAPAENVVITDAIPANTTYVAGSMRLLNGRNPGGLVLTDTGADGDGASCNGTTMTVNFGGAMDGGLLNDFDAAGDGQQNIRFQVTIN